MEQTLGKRIMTHRKRLGLTQDQLAEKLGVSAQAVSKWENDQSCPDIAMIPQLADIFNISTDELLGREKETTVHQGVVVEETVNPSSGKQKLELFWDSGRRSAIGTAISVTGIGGLYLLSNFYHWEISLWTILRTTSLLVFGLLGLYPRFSLFRLCCALAGGCFLLDGIVPGLLVLNGKMVVGLLILLFGVNLLVQVFRREKKPVFSVTYTGEDGKHHSIRNRTSYQHTLDTFTFSGSFSSNRQLVELDTLRQGSISTSFGEFTVDLSRVQALAPQAALEADCSFGELVILVPRRFQVVAESSTSFAEFDIQGEPDQELQGKLLLKSSVNFGEVQVRYL